ncbi:TetR/AcrR family transcriptional regulator [Nocardia sp. NPDC057668]|uniref:TetR/AcrR family transcriptional regulator n=1 Tax=Nocardia sp. NPDC057668 TaxID=3346202 RepID=UPI0036725DB7
MTSSTVRTYGGLAVEDRRAHRRRQFLAAALVVFGDDGYANSSIATICRTAGLARAQLYEHFDNREDLLLAVYDMIQDDARTALVTALSETDATGIAARARIAVTAYAESLGQDPRRAAISFVEIIGVSARVEQHRVDQRRIWLQFAEAELRYTFGEDYTPPGGYASAAMGFVGALMALVHNWSAAPSRAALDDIIETLTCFLTGLAPAPS